MSNAHCAPPSGQQNHEPTLVTWNKCKCVTSERRRGVKVHTSVRSYVRVSSSADSAVGHFWSSVVDQRYCHTQLCVGIPLSIYHLGQHQLCPVNTCLGSCLCDASCIVGHSWRSLVRPGHQPLCWCASVQKVKAKAAEYLYTQHCVLLSHVLKLMTLNRVRNTRG